MALAPSPDFQYPSSTDIGEPVLSTRKALLSLSTIGQGTFAEDTVVSSHKLLGLTVPFGGQNAVTDQVEVPIGDSFSLPQDTLQLEPKSLWDPTAPLILSSTPYLHPVQPHLTQRQVSECFASPSHETMSLELLPKPETDTCHAIVPVKIVVSRNAS